MGRGCSLPLNCGFGVWTPLVVTFGERLTRPYKISMLDAVRQLPRVEDVCFGIYAHSPCAVYVPR